MTFTIGICGANGPVLHRQDLVLAARLRFIAPDAAAGAFVMAMGKDRGPLRAIDLYSGVGGWSLGLRMAGVEVVASYERWSPANVTNFKNNRHQAQTVDIRDLSLDDLPKGIDLVVGSPPCTQFSFSNRGGSGDLDDGLVDIVKFLTVVEHMRPKAWAMENVPRVAPIIEQELKPGGRLHPFQKLGIAHRIVDMSEYGLPQRRKRCIAGNLDFALLESYREAAPRPTLGIAVSALTSDPVVDPLYGLTLARHALCDHEAEEFLNEEEERINRAGKLVHSPRRPSPNPWQEGAVAVRKRLGTIVPIGSTEGTPFAQLRLCNFRCRSCGGRRGSVRSKRPPPPARAVCASGRSAAYRRP